LETFKSVKFSGFFKPKNLKFGLFRFLRFFKKPKKPSFFTTPIDSPGHAPPLVMQANVDSSIESPE